MKSVCMLSTQLPFAGFYDSLWSYEIDAQQERMIDEGDPESLFFTFPELSHIPIGEIDVERLYETLWFKAFDNSACTSHIAKEYAASFAAWLADSLDLDVKRVPIEFEEMTSPREYNFTTDRIFAKLPESVFRLMRLKLAKVAPGALERTFKSMFTSCPGFISHYRNQVPETPIREWDYNQRGALLNAWVDHHTDQIDGELLEHYMYDDIYEAVSDATDFDKVHETAAEIALEWLADKIEDDPNFVAPTPRCSYTMELPF